MTGPLLEYLSRAGKMILPLSFQVLKEPYTFRVKKNFLQFVLARGKGERSEETKKEPAVPYQTRNERKTREKVEDRAVDTERAGRV